MCVCVCVYVSTQLRECVYSSACECALVRPSVRSCASCRTTSTDATDRAPAEEETTRSVDAGIVISVSRLGRPAVSLPSHGRPSDVASAHSSPL